MGSAGSKNVAKAASKLSTSNAARKYPTRTPVNTTRSDAVTPNPQPHTPRDELHVGPSVHPETYTSTSHDQTITNDASDPDLALNQRLRTLGPVDPYPAQTSTTPIPSPFSSAPPLSNPDAPRSTPLSPLPPSRTPSFQPSASAPSQTIFPTSVPGQNPAISLLSARYRLAEEAEREFAQMGKESQRREGRQFLDVTTLRQVLGMREAGVQAGEIERNLGLKGGVVARLGRRGVVSVAETE